MKIQTGIFSVCIGFHENGKSSGDCTLSLRRKLMQLEKEKG